MMKFVNIENSSMVYFIVVVSSLIDFSLLFQTFSIVVNYSDDLSFESESYRTLVTGDSNLAISHTFINIGTFNVKVSITDEQGLTGSTTSQITVLNISPVVTLVTTDNSIVAENSQWFGSFSFSDPGSSIEIYTAIINFGDLTTTEIMNNIRPNIVYNIQHTYVGPVSDYTIELSVFDSFGGFGIASGDIIVTVVDENSCYYGSSPSDLTPLNPPLTLPFGSTGPGSCSSTQVGKL